MKRCNRCIMPETIPTIVFNEDGICNFCLNYKKPNYLGEEELKRIISSIKNENNKYDCIVPVSGGRDSTFALYTAKAVYGLKVLAINYDNEFIPDQAMSNMRNVCNLLNVDFSSVRSKHNIYRKIVLYGIRTALSLGLHEISGALCRACSYGYKSAVYGYAKKYKVSLILWADSPIEPGRDMWTKITEGIRKSKLLKLLNVNFSITEYYMFLQRVELRAPGNIIFSRKVPVLKNKNITEISLFDYIPWDRTKIKDTIITKLGWKIPDGYVSSWKVDCLLYHPGSYWYFKLLGCTKHCVGYCNMINSDQISREEALEQERKIIAAFKAQDMRKLLKDKIGLSNREITKIEILQNAVNI